MANSTTIVRRIALVVFGIWLLAAAPAFANHGHDRNKESGFTQGKAVVGPDQAAAAVRAQTGGRVLGIRAVHRGGRMYYRVKVLKSGYVRIYRVDANSGAVSE